MRHIHSSRIVWSLLTIGFCCVSAVAEPPTSSDNDWPMYNRDVIGTRYNSAESTLTAENVDQLVEHWRYPPEGSDETIGVIHATPVVVDGEVYFGTTTDPAFYKLSRDGELIWKYRNPVIDDLHDAPRGGDVPLTGKLRRTSQLGGVLASALVTGDLVCFADTAGCVVGLDRETGAERWYLNTRSEDFPDAHPLNMLMASPILADGKVIAAGGALEQLIAGFDFYRGSSGRGFVLAIDPATGELLWKFNLGEKPQPLDPPIKLTDLQGTYTFYYGPGTSSIWSTPSFDAESGSLFFGTDVNTSPRRPTEDDPRYATDESCAIFAIDVQDGSTKWSTQINPHDVWTNFMAVYDPKTKLYKDQSIGDTPKLYTIDIDGQPTKVVGAGCKNGGYYVLNAATGEITAQTPIYTGPPDSPLTPSPDPRTIALPSAIGGIQTGCATDGQHVFTNGIDLIGGSSRKLKSGGPPVAGRVVCISADTREELWRHERPKIETIGGPAPLAVYHDVGDPIASGLALAGGVVYCTTTASGKLLALNAETGELLKEIDLGPVWSGPSVSRGRVYVGTGNTLFSESPHESFFPKKNTGELHVFGLPLDGN
ncbi:MAG: PQQ-binding-like beta-propeller repeat protein [Planctomycetaceae bacterium]|nr:PQQ-binding-like beta-propeller repeat protein [Planctomycetaceae bacterium]